MIIKGWVVVDMFFNTPLVFWESAARTRKEAIQKYIEWDAQQNGVTHLSWRDNYRHWSRRCVRCEVAK